MQLQQIDGYKLEKSYIHWYERDTDVIFDSDWWYSPYRYNVNENDNVKKGKMN